MKKIALIAATVLAVAFAAPAEAKHRRAAAVVPPPSDGWLRCGIWILPSHCSPADRIVGSTIVGAALGVGIGAWIGAAGGTIGGAAGASQTAGVGALIGTGVGLGGGALIAATERQYYAP